MSPPPVRATDLDRRMIGLALAILEDAFARTCGGPVKGTAGLRLALAFLWSRSKECSRVPFDNFWLGVTRGGDQLTARYLERIYRAVGSRRKGDFR